MKSRNEKIHEYLIEKSRKFPFIKNEIRDNGVLKITKQNIDLFSFIVKTIIAQQISNEILRLMETVYYKLGHLDPFLLWFPNQSIKFMFAPMQSDLIVHSSRQTKLQSDHLSCSDWLNSKL